jgi:hypothetical protein
MAETVNSEGISRSQANDKLIGAAASAVKPTSQRKEEGSVSFLIAYLEKRK